MSLYVFTGFGLRLFIVPYQTIEPKKPEEL